MKKKPKSNLSLIDNIKYYLKCAYLTLRWRYYYTQISIARYILTTLKKHPKLFEYYINLKGLIFSSAILVAILGSIYVVFNLVTIKNQLLLDLISSFSWDVFSINYSLFFIGLVFIYSVFRLMAHLMKLEVISSYNWWNFISLAVSLSLSFSFFISLETQDGDLIQIILSILLVIFPTKLMNEIFNNSSEDTLDDAKEKLSNSIEEYGKKKLK